MRASDLKLIPENEQPYALLLPGAYCAEHEQGITRLLQQVGIDPNGTGVDGRTQQMAVELQLTRENITVKPMPPKRKGKPAEMVSLASENGYNNLEGYRERNADYIREEWPTKAQWDQSGFIISTIDQAVINFLERLHEASKRGRLMVWSGGAGTNPFARPGLVIAARDDVPQEMLDHMQTADDQAAALDKIDQATGIRTRLADAGLRYYALVPQHRSELEKAQKASRYDVRYFLNPAQQNQYNHGWFTVEELDMWIEGKGPVIKDRAQQK